MKNMKIPTIAFVLLSSANTVSAFSSQNSIIQSSSQAKPQSSSNTSLQASTRRDLLAASLLTTISSLTTSPLPSQAAGALQDSLPIEEFLRTGVDPSGPMGISAQAGKSRPQTGVVFRDGTQVLQGKGGDVSAEILIGTKSNPMAVLASFNSPYKLETGSVFDVECRDAKTGDGAFLAVTESTDGKSLSELPTSFFLGRLFDPTGRFSFYGPPTDVKIKSSKLVGNDNSNNNNNNYQRIIELSFSNLSQSTNAEIPRNAILVATIPKGGDNAVMLVASSNASRWRKGAESTARSIADSFRAVPAPKTSLKLRAKDRSGGQSLEF